MKVFHRVRRGSHFHVTVIFKEQYDDMTVSHNPLIFLSDTSVVKKSTSVGICYLGEPLWKKLHALGS